MKKGLLKIFVFCSFIGFSQNLVVNPSFEQYQVCPDQGGFFNTWQVTGWWGFDYSAAVYANSCANGFGLGEGMPRNNYGYQNARTGNAYTILLVAPWPNAIPNLRDYIQGEFTRPLIKDSLYCVRYWLSLFNASWSAIKNVDAYINDSLLNWTNPGYLEAYKVLVGINPQIKCDRILRDTLNWMEVKGIYKAKGGEKYITIGNFKTDQQTTVVNFGPFGDGTHVNYYLDDVSVTPFNLKPPALGNDTLLCQQQLPLTLTAPLGYDSLKWSTGETTQTISVTQAGKYWVNCIANGCGNLRDEIEIKTYSVNTLKLKNDTTLCKGTSITLQANTGFSSYEWNTGSNSNTINVNNAGTYFVKAKDNCSLQSDSIKISLDSLPDIKITLGENINICRNGNNEPYILSSNYNKLLDYKWNTGAKTPTINVNSQGDYFFISKYRCGTLYSDTIFIQECPDDTSITMYIPNAFSPNEDGLNDTWYPVFLNHSIIELSIYDRWGEKIFTGTKQNLYSWDGMFKSMLCEQGLYAYTITFKPTRPENSNKEYRKTGMICLLRGFER